VERSKTQKVGQTATFQRFFFIALRHDLNGKLRGGGRDRLRQSRRWSSSKKRSADFGNYLNRIDCALVPPCLIGMEACVGAHHLSRKLASLGHDARLMPAKYVQNDFHDAEAIAETVHYPPTTEVASSCHSAC
jgi:transposase